MEYPIEAAELSKSESRDALTTRGDTFVMDVNSGSQKDVSAQWDYVIQFADMKPPEKDTGIKAKLAACFKKKADEEQEKVAESKKFKKIQEGRALLMKTLKDPSVGLTIQKSRSENGNEEYRLITCSDERFEAQAEHIGLNMKLKDKHGGGYASFEAKRKHLYEAEDEKGFFRKIQKIFLIQTIIEEALKKEAELKTLENLIQKEVITRFYPLHELSKISDLLHNWSHPRNLAKKQPLDEVRNYFGEEITMYFAWLGFYTRALWVASAVGLFITPFWAVTYFTQNANAQWTLWFVSIYCVFLALWSTGFQEFWKRYNNELVFKWGMEDFEDSERERPDFYGEQLSGVWTKGIWVPLDQKFEYGFELPKGNTYYSTQSRRIKYFSQLPLVAFMITMVVVVTVSVLSLRLFLQNFQSTLGSIVGGIANAVTIIIMNGVWQKVALKLNRWENHRTDTDYQNSLILKIFSFQFVNSYTSLFYIAFFKGSGDFYSTNQLKDACKSGRTYLINIGNGCMDELTIQLVTILLVNMFVGQGKEVAIPWLLGKLKLFLLKRNLMKEDAKDGINDELAAKLPQWETEAKKELFPGTFDEYSEMVIQYGYITLFAASFPLAPFLAVLNNVTEIRTDAFKLLKAHARPNYRGAVNIGAWYDIINFIGLASVVTNCLLIGYSLSSVPNIFGGVPTNPFAQRISQVPYLTLIVIVVLEHVLFGMKAGLAFIIPDVPGWIQKERAKQEWVKDRLLVSFNNKDEPPKRWQTMTEENDDDIFS